VACARHFDGGNRVVAAADAFVEEDLVAQLHRDTATPALPVEASVARPGSSARPDRLPLRLVAPIYAFAPFFLLVGAAAIVIGVHDAALTHPGLGVTAASAVLLVVGTVLWVGVGQLIRLRWGEEWEDNDRPPCNPIVLVAFLLTFLLGVYVFFSAIGTAGPQRVVVVFAALVLMIVAIAGLVSFGRDVSVTLPRVGGAVALTLLGTVVGAWEFWYQNQYVPSRAARAVSLKVDLQPAGKQPTFDAIRATVGYEAIGGKSVSVVGSAYTLTGSRVVSCARAATVERVSGFFGGLLTDPQRVRFMANAHEETPTVLAAGKFVGDGKRLEPGVPAARGFVFLVPRHTYQLLRFRAQLFAIPGAVQLAQNRPPEYKRFRGDNELYAYWHVDDDSWLHDIVYGRERWVVIRYELVDPGDENARRSQPNATLIGQALHVTARFPKPTWSKGPPGQNATTRLFDQPLVARPSDASEPFAATELPLEPVAAKC
jgi:hypothetical protein